MIESNLQDLASLLTVGVTVKLLQRFLKADVIYTDIGRPNHNQFPGDPACANNHVDLIFHWIERLGNNGTIKQHEVTNKYTQIDFNQYMLNSIKMIEWNKCEWYMMSWKTNEQR